MNHSAPVYVVDAVRSPRGRGSDKGSLRGLAPMQLLARTLRGLAARASFDPAALSDLLVGCVTQTADQGANIGKLAAIAADWPDSVPAMAINRYCASGLSALNYAALHAREHGGLVVAGGIEMMSRVPMASDRGPLTHDFAFQAKASLLPIGIAADVIAQIHGFSRADCDAWALQSQQRAAAAQDAQHFRSLVPIHADDGALLLSADETPRRSTSAESLAALPPAFADMAAKYGLDSLACQRFGFARLEHVHHAGNSPAMADGASAVLLAAEAALARHNLRPRAQILASAEVGVDRTLALTGSVDATRLALARARLAPGDIDLFEVNESFAALMLHFEHALGIARDRLNVNGGAIALGHAMGSTGTALVGTLLDELERRGGRFGVVAICGAAGLASATVFEVLRGSSPAR
jgi:acetyl-CoA C-acetyltransferase